MINVKCNKGLILYEKLTQLKWMAIVLTCCDLNKGGTRATCPHVCQVMMRTGSGGQAIT